MEVPLLFLLFNIFFGFSPTEKTWTSPQLSKFWDLVHDVPVFGGRWSIIYLRYIYMWYIIMYLYIYIFAHMSTCQCIIRYIRIFTFIHRCVRCKAVRIPIMGWRLQTYEVYACDIHYTLYIVTPNKIEQWNHTTYSKHELCFYYLGVLSK